MKKLITCTPEQVAAWEKKAADLKTEILSTPNMEIPQDAVVYYISNSGCDENDGRTPETAIRSIARLETLTLAPGSFVCFERGGVFRGKFTAQTGVTYTAYGEGDKPKIYGSPFNGAEHGEWVEVADKVWRYSEKFTDDIGTLVMNAGEAHGIKIILTYTEDGVIETVSKKPWNGWEGLSEDLSFYHDLGGAVVENPEGGYVYLRCEAGNPAKVWNQIEFNTRRNIIKGGGNNDFTVDNLCIMYGGSHGIGTGTIRNLTVTNCEIGWIGGSLQFYRDGRPTRFGNGIEIYGGCVNYRIDHCYVYECYDAGITHQLSSGGTQECIQKDVYYTNNLIERCIYNIEYFIGKPANDAHRAMSEIYMHDNILVDAGYGFGKQRPNKSPDAHIKGWDAMNMLEGEFVIENNIFLRSKYMMLHIGTMDTAYLPTVRNNVFAQLDGGQFGRFDKAPTALLMYTDETISRSEFADNEFYVIQ